jgi:5-oxopent-3-ene-1,2,5-tricarboxylate decarboxylase/2-hydroxyhepta-2,4-diene-1,7-dioate isomerase
MMKAINRASGAVRTAALLAAGALAASVLTVDAALTQQEEASTFRLLSFAVGPSGPRLGATRGNGDADIVDVHNAVLYLIRTGAPELSSLTPIPIDMRSLIEAGDRSVRSVRTVHDTVTRLRASGRFADPGGARRIFHPPASVGYLPPVPNPSKIVAGAGAYQRKNPDGSPGRHDSAEFPSFFFKPPSSLTGHDTDINLAGLLTRAVHEPEFAAIIGRRARFVPASEVMDYVFGYTILNDVTSRDLPQGQHGTQGGNMRKGLDTFAPAGPYITLKEDVPDPGNLEIVGVIDGVRHEWPYKNGNTRFLTFTLQEALSYLTERMTLQPGDIISTGVPSASIALSAGQTIEITIGNLGTLRNRVVSVPAAGWKPIEPRVGASSDQ